MDKSAWSFFLPQLDGSAFASLQLVFVLVFLAVIVAVPLLLRRSAGAVNWERRLAALEAGDEQAFAHATPEELSRAVATAPERWAEALPGLLLVFGVLGTFVGLGMALGDAAGLLNGRAEALAGLNPVMDALGSKFRIAAWGILAYLFLRLWSTGFAYEEKRLAWSAKIARTRAAEAADRVALQEAEERRELVDAIAALLAAQQAESQRGHVRHAELIEALSQPAARS